jgi:exosortase A-associated hydrolase 2
MNTRARLEPAFIPGRAGPLHTTLFLRPGANASSPTAEALLIVPPFAEEMNKCRPMMAMMGRRAAELGIESLIVDLFGTGDSAGDFKEATWVQWIDDVQRAFEHLESRGAHAIHLLGVRSGALLIAAAGAALNTSRSKLVLWQPVLRGADYWRQFLRLRIAAQAMRDGAKSEPTPQEVLSRDGEIEIAGYSVSEPLIAGLSTAEFGEECIQRFARTLLLEATQSEPPVLSGGVERSLQKWIGTRAILTSRVVSGEPFWTTPEIAKVPKMIDDSVAFLSEPVRA